MSIQLKRYTYFFNALYHKSEMSKGKMLHKHKKLENFLFDLEGWIIKNNQIHFLYYTNNF